MKVTWDKKTLQAVRRWLRREALFYTRRSERDPVPKDPGRILADRSVAAALEDMADLILEKMERAK